ncbi:MFS transporter [Streptomyces phyllanthi]|uniref:MHS family MFS transporter n=1 Tax=Streptomyces phyllanthi TaxID=1803180 RepID=A0A5N8WAB1_9ACTN|nr:MFS transporter [Streptomyces phyllanthi]MPY44417.1 MHS family MFS transporter [Streptomyces phyllanthi]
MASEARTSTPTDDAPGPATHRRGAGAAALASTFEWYDFFLFGTAAALVFGSEFFPSASPAAGAVASFATFAVGFLARPLGSVIGGHFGDRHGRKPVLVVSLLVMSVATAAIGLLPNYASIGIAAPVLLMTLRLIQGAAVGAQWGGSVLLATESAPAGKRGLYGSIAGLGVPLGLILANAVFLTAEKAVSPAAFTSWGWRVPFLAGLLVVGIAWYIHRRVEETPEFRAAEARLAAEERAQKSRRSPLKQVLRHHLGTVLLAGGSFMVNTATFYIMATGTLDYATRELGLKRDPILLIALVLSVVQLAVGPSSAALSDRIGRIKVYTAGTIGLMVWAVPMFLLIDTASYAGLFVGMLVCSLFLGLMSGPQAALFTELFTPEMRFTGASLGYQFATIVGGGFAPLIMVLLLDVFGTSLAVAAYIIVLAIGALCCIALLARGRNPLRR